MKKEDILMHTGDDYAKFMGAIVPPIFQNTLFVQPTAANGVATEDYIYSRINNPTTEIVEKKVAALENAEMALAFSTGMGAISAAIMRCLQKDDHVICVETAYGPTRNFLSQYLPRFGVSVTFVTGNDLKELQQALQPNTRLIYLESPSSFVYVIQDLTAIAALAKQRGIYTVIDNSYATPLYQNPLDFGIDMVVHTATKYLGGHSDVMGGIIAGSRELLEPMVEGERALFGAAMDPHQAWLILRGMRTLSVRLKQHAENARQVAAFLQNRPEVSRVFYPGLPSHPDYELANKQMTGFNGLLSIQLTGDTAAQKNFMEQLQYFQLGVSWGGFESLVANVSVGKSVPGVPDGVVRLHVGLEHADTLIQDLAQALEKMNSAIN